MTTCDGCAALTARVAALEAQAPPVEAFVTLPAAAILLGTTPRGLFAYLQEHRAVLSPPRYRFSRGSRRYRMLPASDVRTLQALAIRPHRRLAA